MFILITLKLHYLVSLSDLSSVTSMFILIILKLHYFVSLSDLSSVTSMFILIILKLHYFVSLSGENVSLFILSSLLRVLSRN